MNANWLRKCGIDLKKIARMVQPRPVVPKARVEPMEPPAYLMADAESTAVDDSVFRNLVDYRLLLELCATPIQRPRVESISVHPLDIDEFRALFADGSISYCMGVSLFAVPVLADDEVWRGKVRVRMDGEDLIMPFPKPQQWIAGKP